MNEGVARDIIHECLFEFNETQTVRLAEYALKLSGDKRYKKGKKL